MWLCLLAIISAAYARGRYEFIDDADLPAFYSMRSAQLAQQAAFLQVPASPGVPTQQLYAPYYPYHFYQPTATENQGTAAIPTTPIQYSPYLHYAPQVYRAQTAAVTTGASVQPRMMYSPYYFGHQAGQLPNNKKTV